MAKIAPISRCGSAPLILSTSPSRSASAMNCRRSSKTILSPLLPLKSFPGPAQRAPEKHAGHLPSVLGPRADVGYRIDGLVDEPHGLDDRVLGERAAPEHCFRG